MNNRLSILVAVLIIISCADNDKKNNHLQEEIPWPCLANSPWPMHMHDPQHTGRSPYPGPSEGEVVWAIEMPMTEMFGNPIIDEIGNIIVAGENPNSLVTVFSFSQDGVLNWSYEQDNAYEGSSALATSDSLIYINIGSDLTQMDVYGIVNWQYHFKRQSLHFSRLTPNISKDGQYIYVSGYDSALYSINSDGTLHWKFSVAPDESYGEATLSPNGKTIYFMSSENILYALNTDGTQKWTVDFEPIGNNTSPVVDNQGNIYVTVNQSFHCVRSDGTIKWSNNDLDYAGSEYNGCCIGLDGTLFVSMLFSYYVIDYNGKLLWEMDLLDEDVMIVNLPVVDVENNVFLGKEWGGSDEWASTNFFSFTSDNEIRYIMNIADRTNVGSPACIDNSGHIYIGSDSYIPFLTKIQ